MIAIKTHNLTRCFIVRPTQPGFRGSLRGFLFPTNRILAVVRNINMEVKRGEKVALIGPNGAGKSTTIKLLTGILSPTSGSVEVLGHEPWSDRARLGYQISTVIGQRVNLWENLSPYDSFRLAAKIYEIDDSEFQQQLKELAKLFEIEELIHHRQVKQLSLGERVKCEILSNLLHRPRILFMDEPTIGLDATSKLSIRKLLNQLCKEYGTTIFLTSHDTSDIEQVCDRVLVLDKGSLIIDSSVDHLKNSVIRKRLVDLTMPSSEHPPLQIRGAKFKQVDNCQYSCEVDLTKTTVETVLRDVLVQTSIAKISIHEPSMDEVIRCIYAKNEPAL